MSNRLDTVLSFLGVIFVAGGVDEADEGVLHLAKEHFRSLVDIF